jgi:hypothetical protein
MAVASLTIANITAKAGEIGSPVLGHDTTVGGTTTHYGPPQIMPDPVGNGKWVPFPIRPIPETEPFTEKLVLNSATDFKNLLNALITPTVSLLNGVVVGTRYPGLNHDGQAYAAYYSKEVSREYDIIPDQPTNFEALQAEYHRNIKSGKWRKFVNGDDY